VLAADADCSRRLSLDNKHAPMCACESPAQSGVASPSRVSHLEIGGFASFFSFRRVGVVRVVRASIAFALAAGVYPDATCFAVSIVGQGDAQSEPTTPVPYTPRNASHLVAGFWICVLRVYHPTSPSLPGCAADASSNAEQQSSCGDYRIVRKPSHPLAVCRRAHRQTLVPLGASR
jgi:hypothetical protein